MFTLVICVVILYLVVDRCLRLFRVGQTSTKHVFITGCDSGFGRDLAVRLDTMGFPVIAACLTEGGRDSLDKIGSSRLRTLRLDVTDPESIKHAEEFVRKALPNEDALWAIVNNAGVSGRVAPIEMCSQQDMVKACQVNLFGPVEVTRVFLPLLRKSRGRVINMASVMGRCPASTGPYSASKYGMEAFSDNLRREVRPQGVEVSIIEPGFFRTSILDLDGMMAATEDAFSRAPEDVRAAYGGAGFLERTRAILTTTIEWSSPYTYQVVDAYVDAITSRYPRPRYVVGWDAKLLFVPLSFLPEWIGDWLIMSAQHQMLKERGHPS